METAGLNETMQIVKVTQEGTEKFFAVSGKALKTTGSIAVNMAKIMALVYKGGKKIFGNNAERPMGELVNTAAGRGENIHVASIDKSEMKKFEKYADSNGLKYSVIDLGKNDVQIAYMESDGKKMTDFADNAGKGHVRFTSLMTVAQSNTMQQINVQNNSYAKINSADIVAVDRQSQLVRVRVGAPNEMMYADVPAKAVKNHNGNMFLELKPTDTCTCYIKSGQYRVQGPAVSQAINKYKLNESNYLKAVINEFPCSQKKKSELLRDPLANKKEITKMSRDFKYGTGQNGRVVYFSNGKQSKIIKPMQGGYKPQSAVRSAMMDGAVDKTKKMDDAMKKAASQLSRKR